LLLKFYFLYLNVFSENYLIINYDILKILRDYPILIECFRVNFHECHLVHYYIQYGYRKIFTKFILIINLFNLKFLFFTHLIIILINLFFIINLLKSNFKIQNVINFNFKFFLNIQNDFHKIFNEKNYYYHLT
jgi:hypothetical protein